MLKHIYVIDFIVRDLDAAVQYGTKIFGAAPRDTSGVGPDQTEFRAAHFVAPGGGKGNAVHSVGFFQLTTDTPKSESGLRAKRQLDQYGEGVILIGFTVNDIDQVEKVMKERGLRFVYSEAQRYENGIGNELEPSPIGGVSFWFAQHDSDGFQKFTELPEFDSASEL